MKVLQVITSLHMGGAEKLISEVVPAYAQKGLMVEVFVLNGTRTPLYQELQDAGIRVISSKNKSVYHPAHILTVKKLLSEYDLVHVHLFPCLYWVAFAKWLHRSKTPLVFTEHSTHNKRRNSWLLRQVDRFAYQLYNRIVTISAEVQENLTKHARIPQEKCKQIPNGVNLDRFRNSVAADKAFLNLPELSKVIIQVSSFRPEKDQQTLIKALVALEQHVFLVLVGKGDTMDDCKTLAREMGVEDRVLFLGLRMDIPDLLKMSDVVVLSSHYEGLSLSSIEGMASGKPFVASNVPGLQELVVNAGVLFERGNDTELGTVLEKLLNNTEWREEVIKSCQKRAEDYSIDQMITSHIELYRKLC